MNQAMNEATNENNASSIGDMLRANPLGAAMVGAGLLWLFAGAKTSEAMLGAARAVGVDEIPATATRAARTAMDAATQGASAVSEMAGEAQKRVGAMAGDAADMMRGGRGGALAAWTATRENVGRMIEAQPLLLALGGLAIGAAIAAAAPTTDVERRALGDTADELKRRATDFVGEQTERASDAISNAATAARDALSEQGGALSGKAQDAARETGKGAGLI